MNYKVIILASLIGTAGLFTGCKEDFAELNQKPSDVTNPEIRYLFTQCARSFQPGDYAQWFGGFEDVSTWAQTTVPKGGNSSDLNRPNVEANGCGYRVNEVLRYANEIRHQISQMSDEDKASYEYIQYLCNPLLVFLSIQDSDMFGSRQYSEAEQARYTNPPLLTPKYDTQEELFEIWLKELDETLAYLQNHNISDVLKSQDFIYNGNLDKWAKLTNSLKLRIAARLLTKDKARAIAIVNEAVAHPAGLLVDMNDNFVYNKGKRDNNWNNNITTGAGSKHLIDFMVENRDPRLFYIFMKNDFNSNVVQGYFDAQKELPFYIAKNVEYEEKDGKKVFKEWKAPGEPWVRFYGLPSEINAANQAENNDYFDPSKSLLMLESPNGGKRTYNAAAFRNQEFMKGMFDYTYPDVPGVTVQDIEDYGWYGVYFSAGETNLLLAEFKLLGANLPESAQSYFQKGIELSVRGYDQAAGLNHIPYYDQTYINDPHDKSIKLTDEMLTEMMSKDICKLTGNLQEDLEKVYIQQYIHYLHMPIDMFVNIRRSGVPMKNSNILPRIEFDDQLKDSYFIPRRFSVSAPAPTDLLYQITIDAYKAQGFTYEGTNSINPETLNKERVWYDDEAKAPKLGEGPGKLLN